MTRPKKTPHPFGTVLTRTLAEKETSLYRLAKILGKERDWLHKLAKGKTGPSVATIVEIADGLDIQPWVLFRELVKEMRKTTPKKVKKAE